VSRPATPVDRADDPDVCRCDRTRHFTCFLVRRLGPTDAIPAMDNAAARMVTNLVSTSLPLASVEGRRFGLRTIPSPRPGYSTGHDDGTSSKTWKIGVTAGVLIAVGRGRCTRTMAKRALSARFAGMMGAPELSDDPARPMFAAPREAGSTSSPQVGVAPCDVTTLPSCSRRRRRASVADAMDAAFLDQSGLLRARRRVSFRILSRR